jgi:Lar family restriction alleviation protein
MGELKSCPFSVCGSTDVLLIPVGKSHYQGACDTCGCTGPISLTKERAVEHWNTRSGLVISRECAERIIQFYIECGEMARITEMDETEEIVELQQALEE